MPKERELFEDFFCDECHGEFTMVFSPLDDVTPADVKMCVYCGAELDHELNLLDDEFEEGWEEDCDDIDLENVH